MKPFDNKHLTKQEKTEQYYSQRDKEYRVDYSDFDEVTSIQSIDDPAEVVEKLGGTPPSAPVTITGKTPDGLLDYRPLSTEAKRLGQTEKYQNAPVVTGEIRLGETTVTYSVPTTATAYDAVPITYSLSSTTPNVPVYLAATAFEEPDRYADAKQDYFDCNLPGKVAIDMEYLGYVLGYNDLTLRPQLSFYADKDKQGVSYPDYTTTELVKSGTVKADSDHVWFRWRFTNVGDTILDGEGSGTFRFYPLLYKKDGDQWLDYGVTYDRYYPMLDYVYPGESGEFWTRFCLQMQMRHGFEEGEYRIVIYGYMTNEKDNYDFLSMQVAGSEITASTFEFSVTKEGEMTPPAPVINKTTGTVRRNKWLGNFEEFMSSYTTIMNPGKTNDTATRGTLYIQPAPWTKQIVLKVIHGDSHEIKTVRIPIAIETDSIQIHLNEDNHHWVMKEDGTRTPEVYTQNMVGMRGSPDEGPYNDHFQVNILRDMKEAGINTLTTEQGHCGSIEANTSFGSGVRYMMDCARKMGFTYEGHCNYYYRTGGLIHRASHAGVDLGDRKDMQGFSQMDASNGILARGNMIRYGDMYLYDKVTKEIPISLEENYGWFTYSLNNRIGVHTEYFNQVHRDFLRRLYDGDIETLNKKYGSSYASFEEIDVAASAEKVIGGWHIADPVFKNWNDPILELDFCRTVERMNQYKEMLKYLNVEGAKVYIRSENATIMAPGISPTTANVHYRNLYYEQRQTASVPEILAASGIIYGDTGYCYVAYSPAEVYELTRQAAKVGLHTAKQICFNHMYDPVVTRDVGDARVMTELRTGDDPVKHCWIVRNQSLFTWCKAIYEAGGVPGLMWMDDCCNLYATSTQYKELQFFHQKIQEMLSTKEGKDWAQSVPEEALESPMKDLVVGAYSYPEKYIEQSIASTPRWNKIMDFVTKNR